MSLSPSRQLQAKRAVKRWWWASRRPTARWRALPDFVIFGAQKSGTTSLYNYLLKHPQVKRPFGQEPVFFSHEMHYDKGLVDYRTNFPLERWPRSTGRPVRSWVTGEASGEYLYHPTAPARIAHALPTVRLILVLRNPVQRTISAYHHNVKLGLEDRPIEDALGDEIRWHTGELEHTAPSHRRFGVWGSGRSYVGRGLYAQHLRPWTELIPSERMLVIEAERMFEHPHDLMREVTDFLEVDPFSVESDFGVFNAGRRSKVNASIEDWLEDVFGTPNQELEKLVRSTFGTRSPELRWAQ